MLAIFIHENLINFEILFGGYTLQYKQSKNLKFTQPAVITIDTYVYFSIQGYHLLEWVDTFFVVGFLPFFKIKFRFSAFTSSYNTDILNFKKNFVTNPTFQAQKLENKIV